MTRATSEVSDAPASSVTAACSDVTSGQATGGSAGASSGGAAPMRVKVPGTSAGYNTKGAANLGHCQAPYH